MQIVELSKIKIKDILDLLKKNKVIIVPTETAYGMLANALNKNAVKKVFEIKKRDVSKELSVFMKDLEMAEEYVEINDLAKKMAEKYLPGALTLVLKLKKEMPFMKNSLGIRISSCSFIKKIMEKIDYPLTATSANIAGQPACYSIEEINRQFNDRKSQPDLVIDSGRLEKGRISTVVDLSENRVKILRQGILRIEY